MNYKYSLFVEDGSLIIGHCDNIAGLLETNISETAMRITTISVLLIFISTLTLNRFAQTEIIP
ncbi:hypothetical protein J3D43_003962 [Paenibacillus xylanexedens]|nr:hypothetical protein [Paenibacillus xylanexedens]